jgi:single stranded DNA-binding protein
MNVINIVGRITADPELKQTPNGNDVVAFTVAVDRYVKDGEKKADFIPCVAWKTTALFIARYFRKGHFIGLTGRLETRPFKDKDGNSYVDYVLTTQEVIGMIKTAGIDFANLEESALDDPYAMITGSGVLFGVTGGVTESVLRFVMSASSKEAMDKIAFTGVRGLEGVKEAVVSLGDKELKFAIVSGLANARALIEKGYNVVYETAQNIFFDFDKDRFRDRFDENAEILGDKYLEADLLIIDDLGVEMVSSFTKACLYNIINTRLNKKLPIIASTNLSGKEIQKLYDDRITSRLLGDFTIKKFVGSDIRKIKGINND